jgi:hypothetical protein
MLTEPRKKARATMASAAARAARRPNDPDARAAAQAARRDYYATALEDYIKRTVDAAPPLTPEQRARLAGILAGGGGQVAS